MKKNILVIEDDLKNANELSFEIEKIGHHAIINKTVNFSLSQSLELKKIDLIMLTINEKNLEERINLLNQLLIKDQIPYIVVIEKLSLNILDRVKTTRPYACLIKPFKNTDILVNIELVITNFSHKNIDTKRHKFELNSEIPFILKKSIEFIDNNIFDKIEMKDVVSNTKWSYFHFLRIFKKYLGITPYQYIINKKIEKAIVLLVETDLPISQIGYKLGFNSHGTFTNSFKKSTGESPEVYRFKMKRREFIFN